MHDVLQNNLQHLNGHVISKRKEPVKVLIVYSMFSGLINIIVSKCSMLRR